MLVYMNRRNFLKTALGAAAAVGFHGLLSDRLIARELARRPDYYLQGIKALKRPLFSNPAMLLAGTPVEIELRDPDARLLGAWLAPRNRDEMLPLGFERHGDLFVAAPPDGIGPGVYDLGLETDSGQGTVRELQPNAVAYFDEFKSDFDFVVLADVHFGPHEGEKAITPDEHGYYPCRRKAFSAICDLEPEFVLLAGDLCMYPNDYEWGFLESFMFLTSYLDRPVHIVPGNHDVYHMEVERLGGEHVFGWDYWAKFYGALYHSTDYGTVHLAGLNSSDWPFEYLHWGTKATTITGSLLNVGVSYEQFEWLKADLAAGADKRTETIVYSHIPLTHYLSGVETGIPRIRMPGASRAEMIALLEQSGVRDTFHGHLHRNVANNLSDNIVENVIRNAGGHMMEYPNVGFAVVHVRAGKLAGYDLVELAV